MSTQHSMHVEVVTPERLVFEGETTMVITRTLDGDIAFQPGHAPFLGALSENHTRIYLTDGTVKSLAVLAGFVEVSDNRVSILADVAELADEIDVERARLSAEQAEAAMAHEDDADAEAALRRAHARLAATGGL